MSFHPSDVERIAAQDAKIAALEAKIAAQREFLTAFMPTMVSAYVRDQIQKALDALEA
jgi:hypothetical protein